MSIIGDWYRSKQTNKSIGPERWGNSYFYPHNLASTLYDDKTIKAFEDVPEVNAILNYRANSKKNVRIEAVNKTTDAPSTSPNARAALKLLSNPNFFQSQGEFIRQTSLWHDITGNEYLYFLRPVGFKPSNTKALYTLPSPLVEVELRNDVNFWEIQPKDKEITYSIKVNGNQKPLSPENIVHLNDNRVSTSLDSKEILKGTSKLVALRGPINNIIAAYKARNKYLVSGGALGILSNASKDGTGGTMNIDPKQKEKLQEEYKKYGNQPDQYSIIISDMALTWQPMSVDLAKMRVFEEVEADFFKICDGFGVSKDLFSGFKGSTFNNQQNSERRFYESTIIPDWKEWIGGINKGFGTETESWELRGDYSHLPIFQENVKERGSALQTLVNALSKALEDGAIDIEQYQNELKKFGI